MFKIKVSEMPYSCKESDAVPICASDRRFKWWERRSKAKIKAFDKIQVFWFAN